VDVSEVDAALDHLGCRADVLTLDPMTLDQVLNSVIDVGRATGRGEAAVALVTGLRARLRSLATQVGESRRPRVAVLEWTDPPFSSGHWVPDMVEAAGGRSVLGRAGERSRQVTWAEVAEVDAEVVVVAPCGFRLDGAAALAEELVGAGRIPHGVPVWAVDADAAFVRPGPRLVDGVEVLASVLHPGSSPFRGDMARPV
jgi:iron complex transport system substrate-binding protein